MMVRTAFLLPCRSCKREFAVGHLLPPSVLLLVRFVAGYALYSDNQLLVDSIVFGLLLKARESHFALGHPSLSTPRRALPVTLLLRLTFRTSPSPR